MSVSRGYPSQEKDDRLKAEFATIEPIRQLQHALSVLAHMFVREVGTDSVEANSTTYVVNATAHAALKGDVIRFTSGTHSGREVKVQSVDTNTITLAETLSSAPANAVTFQILRHKYPVVDATGAVSTTASITPSPIMFVRDSVDTEVLEDTVTPANNRPLPVKLSGVTGDLTITAQNLNVQSTHTGANPDSMQIGDGTETLSITASGQAEVAVTAALPAGANSIGTLGANSGVDIGDVTINNAAGASAVNIQDGGNSITVDGTVSVTDGGGSLTVDGTVAATQSGTWNIADVTGTVSLPTGASTSALQTTGNTSLGTIAGAVSGSEMQVDIVAALPAGTNAIGKLAANDGVDIGDVTINNAAGASAVNVQDGGNSLTVDGTVSITAQSVVDLLDTPAWDTSGANINGSGGNPTQVVASLAANVKKMQILDTTGAFIGLYTGAALSEVLQFIIGPGSDQTIEHSISSGTRISLKRLDSATAISSGFISINFMG